MEKRIYYCLFFIMILVCSCSKPQEKRYVSLQIANQQELIQVYLTYPDSMATDSIRLDEKGEAHYEIPDTMINNILFVLNENGFFTLYPDTHVSDFQVKGDASAPDVIAVSGGALNDSLTAFKKKYTTQIINYTTQLIQNDSILLKAALVNWDTLASLTSFREAASTLQDAVEEYMELAPTSIASACLIRDYCIPFILPERLEKLLSLVGEEAQKDPLYNLLVNYNKQVKMQRGENLSE